MIDTELDWLEIRLNELQHQVDYFVIVEATTTFTGNKKPLHLKSQYDRFEKFHPKIILHTLNLDMQNCSSWDREGYTRNALFDAVFPGLTGPMVPNPGDVIVVSDVDEIPRPVALTILRNCQFPEKTTLRSRFFYYSFQWQHVGDDWPHPQATYYKGLDQTIRPQDLRASTYYGAHDLWDASWHCSSCFSTVAELSHKIESFSHTEYDRPEFKTASEIVRRVRNGLDLFDREKEKYEKVDSRIDVPQYIERNQERFAYLLDRDPANANFVDYENEG
jgi:beta-1,4-mannosyl-glycoprotein beta-1,4-N-acetylglucosaminyltransferase